MASLKNDDRGGTYRIEPGSGMDSLNMVVAGQGHAVDPDPEDVERRIYYIRGRNGSERVVATIRARSRSRAIKIAVDNGIVVDRRELRDD